jgi:putative phosphoribosyl transferase
LRVSDTALEQITARELAELERRERFYREGRPAAQVYRRTVVLIDDGLATGASMMAACRALRPQGAAKVIVAVPVAAKQTCGDLKKEADQIICAATPHPFGAVGAWYEDFSQVMDEDVRKLLDEAAHEKLVKAPGRAALSSAVNT